MNTVRPPAVAGLFYPSDNLQLELEVQKFLDSAKTQKLIPKALIVPHAGYIYSGAVAASAYATLKEIASHIRRVILLGPTHRVTVRGLALTDVDAFDTPLGRVKLDTKSMHSISHFPQVSFNTHVHAQEHSLEVQLPFLQCILDDFLLLPMTIGMATATEVAEILESVWGGEETLIIVSSDLSHYLTYTAAQVIDSQTVKDILELKQPISHEKACGGTPISGLIIAATNHHLQPHLLELSNSGDSSGSHDRVVGYAAIAFTEGSNHV